MRLPNSCLRIKVDVEKSFGSFVCENCLRSLRKGKIELSSEKVVTGAAVFINFA